MHRFPRLHRTIKIARNNSRLIYLALIVVVSTALYLFYGVYIHRKYEIEPEKIVTNTDSVYTEAYTKGVLKHFSIFRELWFKGLESDTFIIPGLKSTRTLHNDNEGKICACASMTPQGVCAAEDMLVISAYCSTKKHNSVLYLVDLETHEFISEVVLPGKPHVGGVTYDQAHRNLWICCYDDELGKASVAAIPYDTLRSYSLDRMVKPVTYSLKYPILSQKQASFLCWRESSLYVGYFTSKFRFESTVQKFRIGETGELVVLENQDDQTLAFLPSVPVPERIIQISRLAQGMTFIDSLVLISQSMGFLSSHIRCIPEPEEEAMLDARNRNSLYSFGLPPMLEQISADSEGRLFLLFESASHAYRILPVPKMDRVIMLQIGTAIPQSVWHNMEIEEM